MNYDFLITGGSISALSTAYVLKKKDNNLKVAVVGNFYDDNSATRCAGAMINCFAEIPYNGFEDPAMRKKIEYALEADGKWREYAKLVSKDAGRVMEEPIGETYCLLSSNSTKVEIRNFDYVLNKVSKDYDGIEEVDPYKVKGLKATDLGRTIRAMKVPDAHLDPFKTLEVLLLALKNLGVELISDKAVDTDCEFMSGKIKKVILKSGAEIQAENYIFAHGFDENKLLKSVKKANKVLPILANGGAAIKLTCPDWVKKKGGLGRDMLEVKDVYRMVDRGGACGIHVVPRGNGEFYIGASSAIWPNAEYTPKLAAVQVLMNSAINEISYEFFHYDVELVGNGFRPVSIDGYPTIGGTSVNNLWINNGMKRDGFTSCWTTAEYLVEGILKGSDDWGIFSPERDLLSYRSRELAVEAAHDVSYGSFIQHYGIEMPLRIPGQRQSQQQWLDEVYKRVKHKKNFGIHPELLHIYADNEYFKIMEPYL